MQIRLIELFAGIGSQAKALENIGVDFEHYRAVEFDKYAMTSYNAIHDTDFETSDITQITGDELGIVDTNIFTYLLTYSFPCQDLSLAGKQAGMSRDSGTRSGLLWEVERLLNECDELPQILLMENVKQVISKKNMPDFEEWLKFLESKGYTNYYQVLNAKDYGIPQNRERCFMFSFLGDVDYKFPEKIELTTRLKDVLENEVDDKYYLSDTTLKGFLKHNEHHEAKGTGFKWKVRDTDGVASCLRANASLAPTDNTIAEPVVDKEIPVRLGGIFDTDKGKHQAGSIWDKDAIAPTIDTAQGGYRQPLIQVAEATRKGYAEATLGDSINLEQPNSKTRRGRVGHGVAQTLTTSPQQAVVEPTERFYKQALETLNENDCEVGDTVNAFNKTVNKSGISPTITTRPEGFKTAILPVVEPEIIREEPLDKPGWHRNAKEVISPEGISRTLSTQCNNLCTKIKEIEPPFRIRKLTPKECWRLMGFNDDDFEKAKDALNSTYYKGADRSNSQLYKQAGNSIVVNVLEYLFQNMLIALSSSWLDDLLEGD